MVKLRTILHPIRSIKKKYLHKYFFKSEKYKILVDTNRKKALDIMWDFCYDTKFPWDNPRTLNEKISYLSATSDTSLWSKCSDKYEVRKYVEDKGLKHILLKCYGVWDSVEDIDFESLPNSFVIKCTHDSGSAIIVKDKAKDFDKDAAKQKLSYCMKRKIGYYSCEPHYNKIKPRIMAEELLEHSDSNEFKSKSMVDYKFWSFNGKAHCCMMVYDRVKTSKGSSLVLDLYDLRPWKQIKKGLTNLYDSRYKQEVPEPKKLDEMVEIVEILSKDFPVVRVDLYYEGGNIYFGELTFTSAGGRMPYYTEEYQLELGNKIDISEYCNK